MHRRSSSCASNAATRSPCSMRWSAWQGRGIGGGGVIGSDLMVPRPDDTAPPAPGHAATEGDAPAFAAGSPLADEPAPAAGSPGAEAAGSQPDDTAEPAEGSPTAVTPRPDEAGQATAMAEPSLADAAQRDEATGHSEWRREIVDQEAIDVEREDLGAPGPRAPWDPAKIRVTSKSWSLRQAIDDVHDKTIDLAPDFQRASVWTVKQRSQLVESILLGIPLPAFYVSADGAGLLQVVDGVQRLTSIVGFADGKFALEGLEYLATLDGKLFGDLDAPLRRRFHQTQIVVNVIEPGTPVDVKLNIFKRINTAGEPLTLQEIRHALSQNRSRDLLRRMATSDLFHRATGGAFSQDRRMDARELVLRFVAFRIDPELRRYEAAETVDDFLNGCMTELDNRAAVTDARLAELEQEFARAMSAALAIFGDHAFRKWPRAIHDRAPLNRALFDSWSTVLADYEVAALEPHKAAIVEATREAFNSSKYVLVLSVKPSRLEHVRLRFDVARQILRTAGV